MQTQKLQPMDIEAPVSKEEAQGKQDHPTRTLLHEIRDVLLAMDKAINNKETRTISKLSKQVRKYRNVIQGHHLLAIGEALGLNFQTQLLRQSKGFKENFREKFDCRNLAQRVHKVIEIEFFIRILLVQVLWRDAKYQACLLVLNDLLSKLGTANKRTLDNYSFLYCYFQRVHQKRGTELSVRQILLEEYNKACVRMDEASQSTLLNLLLRNYLIHNHIEAAFNLIDKTSFPQKKSNNQFCKYLLYTGKVKAVRRQYNDALNRLNQAIRKSPDVARGFKIQCQKLAIVVEMLLGQIPNRQIFSQELMFMHTYPYYKLIQAVLEGELKYFDEVVSKYRQTFQKDKLLTIIMRLNQIVIRIGLRKIYLSYSKISLEDVADKVNISREDVELVVAKALRDGILVGQINHQQQILTIEPTKNVYVTNEPQAALDQRIRYCLSLYHQTQKSITYPEMERDLESKKLEADTNQLLGLLDFDDDI